MALWQASAATRGEISHGFVFRRPLERRDLCLRRWDSGGVRSSPSDISAAGCAAGGALTGGSRRHGRRLGVEEIDDFAEVLMDDIVDMGMKPLHRRRFQMAVAELLQ